MTCKTSYELHHNFPKLADESGFTFNTHRPRVHIDWNKIKLIDIENLIRERKFQLVEQHINNILDCVLESEFDVRILDEGVIKMFRLAQLTVEYQQFCRHYLDRSVYVLRQEITSLAQELDLAKKSLHDKEEELRKIRKRTRHSYKTILPYGNDNIAAMILKTLNNKADIFPSTSRDFDQYNKCKYCEKVFLNQLYLQSHISRRHASQMDVPERETSNETQVIQNNEENNKLNIEVMELKNKLNEMELLITNASKPNMSLVQKETNNKNETDKYCQIEAKSMKDAEVSTNNEDYLLNKIEEWKKEEHEKCNKEINILRNQIMETINSFKQNETKTEVNDLNEIEHLRSTILQQGAEILALKQDLKQSEKEIEIRNSERIKEAEEQISFWTKRAEDQSKQYETLLQKLNDVTKDAKESRELADSERKRAAELQILLEYNLSNKIINNGNPHNANNKSIQGHNTTSCEPQQNVTEQETSPLVFTKQVSTSKPTKLTDRETLENLHRKAQELLNMGSLSSNTSDSSSIDRVKPTVMKKSQVENVKTTTKSKVTHHIKSETVKEEKLNHIQNTSKNNYVTSIRPKERTVKKQKPKPVRNGILPKENTHTIESGSPAKVIRAKLTEEVNNRLVSLGVDPMRSKLPENIFQKQRENLHKQQEIKKKKNPSHEKIRYSLLTYLDSKLTNDHYNVAATNKMYTSQEKMPKALKSLSSMISGVKSKAISLVKLNDQNVKDKRKSFSAEVAKRAISLLKTPPGSTPSSPSAQKHSASRDNVENTILQRPIENSNADLKSLKNRKAANTIKERINTIDKSDSSERSSESNPKYYKTTIVQPPTKSIDKLIKSPGHRPSSSNSDYDHIATKYLKQNREIIIRTQSAIDLSQNKIDTMNTNSKGPEIENDDSSDEVKSLSNYEKHKNYEDNISAKKTKSVLKNASSTSSLNKKKVIFDMDAIQMKSLSATPSQSITEKSDHENYELGLVNLDTEEWDISSIENEPLKNDTKLKLNTRTSPKIAELKQTIESQLARRTEMSSGLVGGVDVMGMNKPINKDSNIGGSNTSLGSSILDESDNIPPLKRKAFATPKKQSEKEDSELDLSEFSVDGITNPNKNESF